MLKKEKEKKRLEESQQMVSNPANERTKKRNINMIRNIKKGEDSDIFKTRGYYPMRSPSYMKGGG